MTVRVDIGYVVLFAVLLGAACVGWLSERWRRLREQRIAADSIDALTSAVNSLRRVLETYSRRNQG